MSAYITKAKQYVPCSKIFNFLYDEPMAAFLDSSLPNELGKYSIIGISPYHVLKEADGVFYINGERSTLSFESYLKEYLKKQKEENPTFLPLVSGGIGYFSYDYGRKFENIGSRHQKQDSMPDAIVVFYGCFFIEDVENQELYLITNGQLQETEKSELLMIVDLERNDLNRICEPGSVKVTELFHVETYATVFHLIANVVGSLQKDVDIVDVLHATFPGGSITGAPKVRAMEIIDELEHTPRGLYTGILGYISLNGDCDFNIAIRTALHQNGTYHVQEVVLTPEDFPNFDEAFLTNSLMGIMPVLSIGKHCFSKRSYTDELLAAYWENVSKD